MKRRLPFHSNAAWPPLSLALIFAFIYGVVDVCFWLIRRTAPDAAQTEMESWDEFVYIRTAIISGFAGLFAGYRLWRFHPACSPAYASWLSLSPWTAGKPLPLGPVHLVWQDFAVLGSLTAFAYWHGHVTPTFPLVTFAFVYFGGLTLLLVITRRWWPCLALGFLWPALMLPVVRGQPEIIVFACIILVIWRGHEQSLKAFPWTFLNQSNRSAQTLLQLQINLPGTNAMSPSSPHRLGWPVQALSSKIQPPSISMLKTVALSALFGWWSYCLMAAAEADPLPELIMLFGILAAFIRLVTYFSAGAPPFNFLGRLATGRIVIPGFDRVFLTPVAAVLVTLIGSVIIKRSGSWYLAIESCTIAVIWCTLLGGGPSLRSWLLTGQIRLRPPPRQNTSRQMVRPL